MSDLVVARKMMRDDMPSPDWIPDNTSPEQYKQIIRDTTKKAVIAEDKMALAIGELLYEIISNEYFKEWGFTTLNEYIEGELEFGRRKAYYLMKLYEKFVVELGLPVDELRDIVWSKAKELLPVVDENNVHDLLDKIKGLSVSETKEMVKNMKGGGQTQTQTTKMTFQLSPEQAQNVNRAFEVAGRMTGSDVQSNLLDVICSEFNSTYVGSNGVDDLLGELDTHIQELQRIFGVKLSVEQIDQNAQPGYEDN